MLNKVSEITSLNVETIILILMITVAIILQLIILTARLHKNKKLDQGVNTKNTKELEQVNTGGINLVNAKNGESYNENESVLTPPTPTEFSDLDKGVNTQKEESYNLNEEVSTRLGQVNTPKDDKLERVNTRNKKLVPSNVITLGQVSTREIKKYLKQKYASGDVINVKDVISRFNLTPRKWSKLREELHDVIEIKGTKSFYRNDIALNKNDKH